MLQSTKKIGTIKELQRKNWKNEKQSDGKKLLRVGKFLQLWKQQISQLLILEYAIA